MSMTDEERTERRRAAAARGAATRVRNDRRRRKEVAAAADAEYGAEQLRRALAYLASKFGRSVVLAEPQRRVHFRSFNEGAEPLVYAGEVRVSLDRVVYTPPIDLDDTGKARLVRSLERVLDGRESTQGDEWTETMDETLHECRETEYFLPFSAKATYSLLDFSLRDLDRLICEAALTD